MGLDITMSYRPKSDYAELTTFGYNNPLFAWVEKHIIEEIDIDTEVLITLENLQKLRDTLEQLNETNCQELFPVDDDLYYGVQEYNQDYWNCVAELKRWVTDTLSTFDFEKNDLLLTAWW
ncbi:MULTISPECIES: hypothetical protein [Entomomonas]|uniref:Uncharacterized protein n=1 Tax=Entomomonas asaccharolytica TaxID=2785331 RepID=A0A974RY35_9GAMM|nr:MULTISPECIES: hypothetical protein [Entomomonas]QQP86870.1 hypothetical protein JHT90_06405 [Entomomonas asaccharolytica]UYZ83512.1 hypothetical protein MTZ49_13050 [Entomomonas sp. E2T0]